MHVVIVTRDLQVGAVLKDYLERRYIRPTEVVSATTAACVQWPAESFRPSAFLLASRRPDALTLELCRRLACRAVTTHVPLAVALDTADEGDRIALLDAGADAIVQPIELTAIEARLRTLCDPTNVYRDYHGPSFVLKAGASTLLAAGALIALTRLEATILRALMNDGERVVTRGDLEHRVGFRTSPRTLAVHVFRLRKKLAGLRVRIETVRGVGYRYVETR